MPRPRLDVTPQELADVDRLLAAARNWPGTVAGIPAGLWYRTLLLTILDTGLAAAELVRSPRNVFDAEASTLTVGPLIYGLHPAVAGALREIVAAAHGSASDLFPRTFDIGNEKDSTTLHRHLRRIARHAGVSTTGRSPRTRGRPAADGSRVHWLRSLALRDPAIVARLNLSLQIEPVPLRRVRAKQRQLRIAERLASSFVFLEVPAECSLVRFFEDVYRPLRLSTSSEGTIEKFRTLLNSLRRFAGVEPHFGLLTDDTAERFLAWLVSPKRINTTTNGYYRTLLALWRFAWRKRKVADLPRDIDPLREDRHEPDAWSLVELARLIDTGRTDPEILNGVPMRIWWPAFLQAMYVTGVRVAALRSVPRADYDETTGWLIVRAPQQKQRSDQRFKLSADAIRAIADLLPYCSDRLFPFPFVSPHPLRNRLRKLLQTAGLPTSRLDLFHKIRRTTATYIADAADEEAARRHLGHSSLQVTRRYLDQRKIRRTRGEDVLPQLPAADDRTV